MDSIYYIVGIGACLVFFLLVFTMRYYVNYIRGRQEQDYYTPIGAEVTL